MLSGVKFLATSVLLATAKGLEAPQTNVSFKSSGLPSDQIKPPHLSITDNSTTLSPSVTSLAEAPPPPQLRSEPKHLDSKPPSGTAYEEEKKQLSKIFDKANLLAVLTPILKDLGAMLTSLSIF